MSNYCLNCNTLLDNSYCGNCGQSSKTHVINWKFLVHDIEHGLFHFDSGILHTTKNLLKRHGHFIREFIQGKRINHVKPITFVVLMATIYGILNYFIVIPRVLVVKDVDIDVGGLFDGNQLLQWIDTHHAFNAMMFIPIFALASFWAFKKTGYNYIQHLVVHLYLAGMRLFMKIIVVPVLYIFNDEVLSQPLIALATLCGIIYSCYSLYHFFNELTPGSRWKHIGLWVVNTLLILGITLLIIGKTINFLNELLHK
jgi:hypothetical protein